MIVLYTVFMKNKSYKFAHNTYWKFNSIKSYMETQLVN